LPGAHFDAVELVPEIRRTLGFFARANGGVADRPNVRLHVADARTYAAHAAAQVQRGAGQGYDLVIGDLFHAAQAGTGALYAAEHFQAVARLVAGRDGVYVQWVPLHEVPPDEARALVRTFFAVFPQGAAVLGTWTVRTPILALVGAHRPLALDWEATAAFVRAPPERAARAAVSEIAALDLTLAGHVAGADRLRAWAGPGPHNTDDRPRLELGAPRGRGPSLGAHNVLALMPVWDHPDFVRWGDPTRSAAVAQARAALQAYLRGSAAFGAGDLDAAEQGLRQALERRPDLTFAAQMLADLAGALDATGAPDRAAATRAWLASLRARR
jgi:spermidine synthase